MPANVHKDIYFRKRITFEFAKSFDIETKLEPKDVYKIDENFVFTSYEDKTTIFVEFGDYYHDFYSNRDLEFNLKSQDDIVYISFEHES